MESDRIEGFGGRWTEQKLEVLQEYLRAYLRIFTRNPKARFFHTVYVDAFAGAGYIRKAGTSPGESSLFRGFAEEDASLLIEGSARRALGLDPGFKEYLFIEQDEHRCAQLRMLSKTYADKLVRVENAEANEFLQEWCRRTDWSKTRAVVFLDPFGMEVVWETVEIIAATKGIDLWYLFPVGALMRLLTQKQPPGPWAEKLTSVTGSSVWEREFYEHEEKLGLFGTHEVIERSVDTEKVGKFLTNRLRAIFAMVASEPLLLKNSRNAPLYLFCFAAGNPRGAPTAVKIATYLIRDMQLPHSRKADRRKRGPRP